MQTGKHHIGLEQHGFEHHTLGLQLAENHSQHVLRDFLAALQRVRAVHRHFGFDDGHQSGLLAQGGITRQGMRIGGGTSPAGDAVTDGDHRAPLGEARAHLEIFRQALAQTIQAFGDFFTRMAGQFFCAGIHLDTGNDARIEQGFGKRPAIFGLLAYRLVEQDRTTDALV